LVDFQARILYKGRKESSGPPGPQRIGFMNEVDDEVDEVHQTRREVIRGASR
jgi:hypothetical protein